jgi:hypothetical protein
MSRIGNCYGCIDPKAKDSETEKPRRVSNGASRFCFLGPVFAFGTAVAPVFPLPAGPAIGAAAFAGDLTAGGFVVAGQGRGELGRGGSAQRFFDGFLCHSLMIVLCA